MPKSFLLQLVSLKHKCNSQINSLHDEFFLSFFFCNQCENIKAISRNICINIHHLKYFIKNATLTNRFPKFFHLSQNLLKIEVKKIFFTPQYRCNKTEIMKILCHIHCALRIVFWEALHWGLMEKEWHFASTYRPPMDNKCGDSLPLLITLFSHLILLPIFRHVFHLMTKLEPLFYRCSKRLVWFLVSIAISTLEQKIEMARRMG